MFYVNYRNDHVPSRGFHIVLNNGFSLSVQFGSMNYCENRKFQGVDIVPYSSKNAEIAIFYGGEFMPISSFDDVQGWVSPDDVAKILGILQPVDTEKEGFYGDKENDRALFKAILQEDILNVIKE
jgi:hypothetical protein